MSVWEEHRDMIRWEIDDCGNDGCYCHKLDIYDSCHICNPLQRKINNLLNK